MLDYDEVNFKFFSKKKKYAATKNFNIYKMEPKRTEYFFENRRQEFVGEPTYILINKQTKKLYEINPDSPCVYTYSIDENLYYDEDIAISPFEFLLKYSDVMEYKELFFNEDKLEKAKETLDRIDIINKTGAYLYDGKDIDTNLKPYIKHFVFKKTTKIIPSFAFSECKLLDTITIPETVKKIKDFAFYNCENLRSVYVYEKTEIAEDAFDGCEDLTIFKFKSNQTEFEKTNPFDNSNEGFLPIKQNNKTNLDVEDFVKCLEGKLPFTIEAKGFWKDRIILSGAFKGKKNGWNWDYMINIKIQHNLSKIILTCDFGNCKKTRFEIDKNSNFSLRISECLKEINQEIKSLQ